MKRIISMLLSGLLYFSAEGQTIATPRRLRCDFLLHADKVSSHGMDMNQSLVKAVNQEDSFQFVRIISPRPAFSWEVDSSIKKLTAFRVLVASSPGFLNSNHADFWDSKKKLSAGSKVLYAGKPLLPGKIYYWKVQAWNGTNVPSAFSTIASFYYDLPNPSDPFSHYPLAAAMQAPVLVTKQGNGNYFLDFGKDGFSQLFLHLTSEKNDSIWIEAAEALESAGQVSKAGGNIRYILRALFVKKGTHDYTIEWPENTKRNSRNPVLMPGYIGEVFPFRYVTIDNFKGLVDKKSVQRKIIFYPFDDSASYFNSSDTILNTIWDLCRYSIKATSFAGYYVDGDRERLPYEADALINQLSHYTVDAEYSMARRSMAFLLFHPTWPTEWSLQNVPLAWNDYQYTGDDRFLQKYYPELQKKILMPLAGENGLISTTTNKQTNDFLESIHMLKDFDGKHGLKDNVDWPQRSDYTGNEKEYKGETDGYVYSDYNAVINAWYYHSLKLMQKIALTLRKHADATFYEQKAKEVYQSFQQVFRDEQSGLIKDGDTTRHTSLHANMFALAFGLVPANDIPAVTSFIKTRKMACSVYGAQFLLEALYDAGQAEYALSLLNATTQRSWYNMIRAGSTITMEAWDKVYKPNLDLNHAWGAAPANIIVKKLMGVEPLTAGFETFRIKPQIATLRFAELKTTTIRGVVWVSWKRNVAGDRIEVSIPGGTTANIVLPFEPGKPHLLADGKRSSISPVNGFFTIKAVQAGKHVFVLRP
ncbi:MAG: alpha-L-rhamnosidase [Ferruginibacter sp.]|nr:alpha-L-rhamnosidase [Ferruginibacter sp.]